MRIMNNKTIKLLLVEDNPMDARMIKTILAKASHDFSFEIILAETLLSAQEQICATEFDLILLDLSLPDETGLITLFKILEHAKGVPIIVLTVIEDETIGIKAVQAGAQDYLVKGQVSNKMLLRSIRYATERYSLIKQLEKSRKIEVEISEEKFRHIYYNSPVMIYSFDDECNISDVNLKWLEITGYSKEETIGRRMDFLIKEDMQLVSSSAVIPEFSRNGYIKGFPCQYIKKDGGIVDIILDCILTRTPSGKMMGLSVAQDITERVKIERELRKTQEQLESRVLERTSELENANRELQLEISERKRFAEALKQAKEYAELIYRVTPSAIFTIDRELNLTSWNNKAAELTGYSAGEVIGQKCFILCLEKCSHKFEDYSNNICASTKETVIVTKSGKLRTILKNTDLLKDTDGNIIGGIESFEDITERKTNEEQLRKLSYAIEQSPIAVVITNIGGIIEYVNPKFTSITGYKPEEVIGRTPRILSSGKTPRETYNELWKSIREGRLWHGEIYNKKKNGDHYWELATISPIKNAAGEITHFLAVEEDITERKKFEFELREAKILADNANKAKSEFLANISHEIRTPLNGIIGFTDLLSNTQLANEQMDYVKTIRNSGIVLLNLINEILDFSKIEAGQTELESICFDIEMAAYEVCEMISFITINKPIEILCNMDERVPGFVMGDVIRFKQVITNLMSNAAKFTEKGEIELILNVEDEDPEKIKIHGIVRDTGIGISSQKIELIFEAFKQADGSITRKYGGSGLGLSICKKLVTLMNGEIWVQSPVTGGGSIFHFTLWLKKAEQQAETFKTPEKLENRKVLVADDSDASREMLQRIIGAGSLKSTGVASASEALNELEAAYAKGEPYEMAILDIQMPNTDGYSLARRIRSSNIEQIRNIPLLAFSSLVYKDIKKFIEADFNGFLPKPVRRQKTLEIICKIFQEIMDSKFTKNDAAKNIKKEEVLHIGYKIKVLLVEDHPVNQKLVKIMLASQGYQVDVANNGEEALELYKKSLTASPYDLIFMDIQMPIMDGYTASLKIREFEERHFKFQQQNLILHYTENPEKFSDKNIYDVVLNKMKMKKVPIISMTANAIKGDREKCIEAGMDDYIAKPVKNETIISMIEKWVLNPK